MDSQSWVTLIGIVLSCIGFWVALLLNQIKKAQQQLADEIKEMNIDIREILTSMARGEEKVKGLSARMDTLYDEIYDIAARVLKLEQV